MMLLPHTRQFILNWLKAIVPVIKELGPSEEINRNLQEMLLGEPETPYDPAPMTREQTFAVKIFKDSAEIHTCIERLKDFETYVSRFPFQRTRVTRDAYLQMVVGAPARALSSERTIDSLRKAYRSCIQKRPRFKNRIARS